MNTHTTNNAGLLARILAYNGPAPKQTTRLIKHDRNLDFTIVAEVHDHRVAFTLYDVMGWQEGDVPLWHKAGGLVRPDPADSLDDAEPFLHGEVKWDGTSAWRLDEQQEGVWEGGSRKDVQRFGDVMALCWDWTGELLPNWDP